MDGNSLTKSDREGCKYTLCNRVGLECVRYSTTSFGNWFFGFYEKTSGWAHALDVARDFSLAISTVIMHVS